MARRLHECGHCRYPSHTSDNCQKRASENKSNNKGNSHQRSNNRNYRPNITGLNNSGNIVNITELQALSTVRRSNDPYLWSVDSSCNVYFTPFNLALRHPRRTQSETRLMAPCEVHGIGTVELHDENGRKYTLHDFLYVPDAPRPLLSQAKLMRDGFG
jgi:hypothetical protein